MQKKSISQSGIFNPQILLAFALCLSGMFLALLSFAATPPSRVTTEITIAPATLFDPDEVPTDFALQTNNLFPGVPLPSGMASSLHKPLAAPFSLTQQSEPLSRDQTAGFNQDALTPQAGWALVTSPNASGALRNVLNGVTCVSASDCWAAGNYYNDGVYQTLIERWDGTSWTIVTSPNTTGNNFLKGVTCVSASDCWAVGAYYKGSVYQALIERWDGTSWAIFTSPNTLPTQDNILNGVTCASASNCWAVGNYYNGGVSQTLIQRWDGTSWAIVTSPNANATQTNLLNGVTCASASDCWAVGYNDNGGSISQTLIERWDGTSWTIVTSPNAIAGKNTSLNGVTCTSASNCWAVGYYYTGVMYQTVVERWNGTLWAIVPSPNTGGTLSYNALNGVTCSSASDCWAVGYYTNDVAWQALVERWDGTSWTITPSSNTSAVQNNVLKGVTCVSASDCWAVGSSSIGSSSPPLTERWDGTAWSLVASASVSVPQQNFLQGVTCVSASDCWAVGYFISDTAYQTLIERWDGTSWAIVTSPNTNAAQFNFLYSVTCASASDCWAVGDYYNGSVYQTLIEHWNGTSWTLATSPNASAGAAQDNLLRDVTCVSASECWAVGYYGNNITSVTQTLIERWDGASWTIVNSPNLGTTINVLNGVTCASASDCWAVGYYEEGIFAYQSLIARWDGTSWTLVVSPNTLPIQDNVFNGVTCVSASDCWAVGYYSNGNGVQSGSSQSLIEHWNGTSWTIVTSPNTSATESNLLNRVVCKSASNCWAVGDYGSVFQTLIERWDGASWTLVTSPNANSKTNSLQALTCASASNCWAVGYFLGKSWQTLTEHFTSSLAPTPTSAVSRKLHGSAGLFDFTLPLTGTPGVECRTGGPNGEHQIVFKYSTPVTVTDASITPASGKTAEKDGPPVRSADGKEITVNLKNVSNAQTVNITLLGVSDGTNTNDVSVPMGVLLGDTTGDGVVNSADIAQTKSQSGQFVTSSNFREDVTVDGNLNSGDIALTKSKSGTGLP